MAPGLLTTHWAQDLREIRPHPGRRHPVRGQVCQAVTPPPKGRFPPKALRGAETVTPLSKGCPPFLTMTWASHHVRPRKSHPRIGRDDTPYVGRSRRLRAVFLVHLPKSPPPENSNLRKGRYGGSVDGVPCSAGAATTRGKGPR